MLAIWMENKNQKQMLSTLGLMYVKASCTYRLQYWRVYFFPTVGVKKGNLCSFDPCKSSMCELFVQIWWGNFSPLVGMKKWDIRGLEVHSHFPHVLVSPLFAELLGADFSRKAFPVQSRGKMFYSLVSLVVRLSGIQTPYLWTSNKNQYLIDLSYSLLLTVTKINIWFICQTVYYSHLQNVELFVYATFSINCCLIWCSINYIFFRIQYIILYHNRV